MKHLFFLLSGLSLLLSSCSKDIVATFTASKTTASVEETITFTNQSENADHYNWKFGDGQSSTDKDPSHSYNAAGIYLAELVAFSKNEKKSDDASATITITETSDSTPVADFSANQTTILAGGSVNFFDLSTNSPTNWSWNFGDGGTSTLQNPSHTYTTAGNYTVSLTATNSYGSDTETKTDYITVNQSSMGSPCPGTPTVTDTDGNIYNTVQIGSQCWLAENLKVGTMINSSGGGQLQTDNGIIEKYCYNNASANCSTYGGLYEWNEMMQYSPSDNGAVGTTQGICPSGWHIPTDAEWKTLEMELGMSQTNADATGWRGTDEGGKLKEAGTAHWTSPNTGATDESGFTALPGGGRGYSNGDFYQMLSNGIWWSATESNSSNAWHMGLYYNYATVERYYYRKEYGYSVRCVKN
ncbi:MAG: PKD domain-containing protein [Bacteroidia bacterium]|nr:PKD domain-containing protein [Bacteroidia bacterium]